MGTGKGRFRSGAAFGAIDDPYIRERMQDVRVVADKVQAKLIGRESDLASISGRAIIMAHDLTPADTVELQVDKIMGFATVRGGKTSHTGIMARSLGIPALVGTDKLEDFVRDGDLVILDGLSGKVVVNPTETELEDYNERAAFSKTTPARSGGTASCPPRRSTVHGSPCSPTSNWSKKSPRSSITAAKAWASTAPNMRT